MQKTRAYMRTRVTATHTYTHIHTHTQYKTHTQRAIEKTQTHAYAVKKKKTDFQETTVNCIIIYIPRIMSANLNGAIWNDISNDIYKY